MKRVILCILVAFSSGAYASKARVGSLLGANHLVDPQTVFTVPSHVNLLSPFLTFEFGSPATDAEGGLMTNAGSGKLMAYVGHQNTTAAISEIYGDLRTSNSYVEQQNPIEVIYGFNNMGFGLSLSHGENKTDGDKETTAVFKWGMNFTSESWLYAHARIWDSAERRNGGNSDKLDTMPHLKVGTGHALGMNRIFGELNYGQSELDAAVGADSKIKDLELMVGFENRSMKTEAADIYFGAMAAYADRDIESRHVKGYKLPAFIGIEVPVTSWATFRSSVKQNILVGMTKDETVTNPKEDSIDPDTTVAAGLGLKHGNLVLDGLLTAASNGQINGNQFISQASVTYSF